jgi:hypothetical protein
VAGGWRLAHRRSGFSGGRDLVALEVRKRVERSHLDDNNTVGTAGLNLRQAEDTVALALDREASQCATEVTDESEREREIEIEMEIEREREKERD